MIPALLPLSAIGSSLGSAAASAATSAAASAASSVASAGSSFGAALAQAASQGLNTLRSAENTAAAGIDGTASVQQVVDGVMEAERTLQTALAIRDKAVTAWQQISQMQI